jgi:hypothetical protein
MRTRKNNITIGTELDMKMSNQNMVLAPFEMLK